MKVDMYVPGGGYVEVGHASEKFQRKFARWTKKLKNGDAQSQLLLRLALEAANTFRMFERRDDFSDDKRRELCGRASRITMTKLRQAMKEEPWK